MPPDTQFASSQQLLLLLFEQSVKSPPSVLHSPPCVHSVTPSGVYGHTQRSPVLQETGFTPGVSGPGLGVFKHNPLFEHQ
jgi:hypothetical protein